MLNVAGRKGGGILTVTLILAGLLPAGCPETEDGDNGDGPGGPGTTRPVNVRSPDPVTRATAPIEPDPATVARVEAAIGRMAEHRGAEMAAMDAWIRGAGPGERAAILTTLIRHYDSQADPAVRKTCLLCLLPFGSDAAAVTRRALRSDADRGVREVAAHILGEVGGESHIDDLFQAILDDEAVAGQRRLIAAAAIGAIGEIGGARAAEVLKRIWKIESMAVGCREGLLVALGYTGDPAGVPLLAEVLDGQDELLRPSAVTALGALVRRRGGDAAVRQAVMPLLRGRLGDDDVNVRRRAARVLGWIGDRSDARRLAGLLEDPYKVTTTITLGGVVKHNDVYPVREEAQKAIDAINARLAAESRPSP